VILGLALDHLAFAVAVFPRRRQRGLEFLSRSMLYFGLASRVGVEEV
jgi:hypothetical protein